MALNEIGIHFYEKKIDKLLDSDDRKIIRDNFVNLQSTIDDLYAELQDRAERIAVLESELTVSSNANEILNQLLEEQIKEISKLKKAASQCKKELGSKEVALKKLLDNTEIKVRCSFALAPNEQCEKVNEKESKARKPLMEDRGGSLWIYEQKG